MASADVFRVVEAFQEHHTVWSEESKDSQDKTIRLFNPGGVLNGF